ncbi:MAG: aldo/keto reductase, partial [Trueperaceae bacterium]|nr:aldo/keto reductase [Trueperaceae bacterium]
MNEVNASKAGRFMLGGEVGVNRLGFGAMRVTGPGVWGPPEDPEECLATLRDVPELGIDLIDTADSYGPLVSEPMIAEALYPYPDGLVIATKGGQARTGPNRWVPLGRPEYLIQQVQISLRLLRVEQIALWQLHRIDPKVPRDEQFGAIRQMLDEGLIRLAGLSEVGIEEIEAARKVFPVASVQ